MCPHPPSQAGRPARRGRRGPESLCASRGRAWSRRRSYKTRARSAGTGSARGPPFRLQNAGAGPGSRARPGAPAGVARQASGGASFHPRPSVFASLGLLPRGREQAGGGIQAWPPDPGPAGPSSRRGTRAQAARPCRVRGPGPGPGGEPGQGARSRAPEGPADSPPVRAPRDPPAPQCLAWGCAFHSPHADVAKGEEIILRRRFAFEEDGEAQREAPRNGIDLDINPGRLPPPPEPRGRAAPSPGRGSPPGRRPAGSAGLARLGRQPHQGTAGRGSPSPPPRARGLDARLCAAGAAGASTAPPRPTGLPSLSRVRSAAASSLPAPAARRPRSPGSPEAAKPPVSGRARTRAPALLRVARGDRVRLPQPPRPPQLRNRRP
ncbi:collagen alpha-1(I) chain-like [Enhydra lutris kenyoni]|uniref:Collagen alpha-1(I) chain-like n=1 Tax=Enhydra lutris kenyoni TaxID=391180 RepID=A0A2Y9K7U6_ENHLU|nr:collagen alpha-1(I) chain-like [Enhydra lutris kenyoni]